MHTGYGVDRHQIPSWYINKPKEIEERERQYRCRKNLWKLPLSLYTFYELLFPEFIATESDGEVILTKFFKHHKVMRNIDLSEYYDSEYTETESSSSETEPENEDDYSNDSSNDYRYSD
jgi:hypothetical protein